MTYPIEANSEDFRGDAFYSYLQYMTAATDELDALGPPAPVLIRADIDRVVAAVVPPAAEAVDYIALGLVFLPHADAGQVQEFGRFIVATEQENI